MLLNQEWLITLSKLNLFDGSLMRRPVIKSLAESEIWSQIGKSNSRGPESVILMVSS